MFTNILSSVPVNVLLKLSSHLSKHYPVDTKRIYQLILQVDSVDVAIELLNYHREHTETLDYIVMNYLQGRDSMHGEDRVAFDINFNRGRYENWYMSTHQRKV